MRTSAVGAYLAETGDPASIVLEAERAALADVESFERQTLRLVTVSCLRAVLVQKRTEARIKRLRERMTTDAQLRRDRIRSEMEALEGDISVDISLVPSLDSAIARVTAELAGISESS